MSPVPRPRDSEPTQTRDLHRLLVEAVRDYAIFALDTTGHILTWNPGAQRFKGYEPHEIIGQHFSVFYPPADIAAGKPDMELEVATREGRFEDEGWRLRKDGSRFWANVVITALRDDGELVGFGKVTRDLTERRAAEERAIEDARLLAEAEAADRGKSEFLATMSHELRTPLNAIAGYVELLETGLRGPVNEKQVEDLRRIRRSQQHLLGIINDLLNFSRLGSGTVNYTIEDVPLRDAFEATQTMLEPLARAKGLRVEWPIEQDLPMVRADLAKIEQILVNLISNAVKFTPSAGRITVACAVVSEGVEVTVSDTGIGIPGDQLEAIFEPFVQVGRTLTSDHEGTGLGLAISRDLARAMGGDLTAESKVGKGSVFTLLLPAARP